MPYALRHKPVWDSQINRNNAVTIEKSEETCVYRTVVIMLRLFFIIILLFPLSRPNPVYADQKLSEILDGIRKRYGHLPGLTIPYKREIITKSMAMLGEKMSTDLAAGMIHFRPPYSLRIQQETPRTEDVITDGSTLWWYIPQKKQVYQYPAKKSAQELRLLSDIFQGLRKVEESFIVVMTGLENEKEYQLQLNPDPPWSQIELIHLSVEKSDFQIRVVEIYNYLGSITRFILGDLSVQEQFEEGFFRFVVPDGVKVMEEGG